VTIAIRPFIEAGCAKKATDRGQKEANYFLCDDWTTQISLIGLTKLVLGARDWRGSDRHRRHAIWEIWPAGQISAATDAIVKAIRRISPPGPRKRGPMTGSGVIRHREFIT
jgi:hypothetical protein